MSRQLTTLQYHALRLDPRVNLSMGFTWSYDYTNSLGGGGVDHLKIVTGPKPVVIFALSMSTDGARGALLELFFGGEVGGGQPVPAWPLNHERWAANPVPVLEDSSFITTPGSKIGERAIGDNILFASDGPDTPLLVLAASSDYYMSVTNLHNQTAEIRIGLDIGAIDTRVDTL